MAVESLFERYGARKHPRLSGYDFDCGQCGETTYRKPWEVEPLLKRWEFPQKPSAAHGKVFCSLLCKHGFHAQQRVALPCLHCGVIVDRPPSFVRESRQVFCSAACRDRFGLEAISCCWPGCPAPMPARRIQHPKFGQVWKVELSRSGQYVRRPLCGSHLVLVLKHLPERQRVQMGHTKWFKDPCADLGTRGITNDASKLMIWAKTGGRCAGCKCDLNLSEKPRRWHIDHVTPVFKGGKTNYSNLMPLCAPCHRTKSAPERAEASREWKRARKSRRWLTHPEKDALIAALREEVDQLRLQIAKSKEERDGIEEGQRRRVSRRPKGLRERQRDLAQGSQGAFQL